MVFMGACALVGGALAVLLPETLGAPMMNSLEELDGISSRTKPTFAWWSKSQLEAALEKNKAERASAEAKK